MAFDIGTCGSLPGLVGPCTPCAYDNKKKTRNGGSQKGSQKSVPVLLDRENVAIKPTGRVCHICKATEIEVDIVFSPQTMSDALKGKFDKNTNTLIMKMFG